MASRLNKPKSSFYGKKYPSKDTRFKLQQNLKGFLCTCSYGEKDCQKEAINLLREYSEDKDKSLHNKIAIEEETTDIMDSLDDELQNLSKKDNSDWKKFTPLVSGVGNCVFISTTIEDPCDLMYKILEDIEKTKVQKTKFLLRMLPISITCKAKIPSILMACTDLLAKHFSTEPTTYAINFNHRYNNSVPRNQLIEELAKKVASLGKHTVDLSGGAKMTIIVEVVKSICCLSVLKDYGRFCKFNLLSVCGRPEKRTTEDDKGEIEINSPKVKKHEEKDQVNNDLEETKKDQSEEPELAEEQSEELKSSKEFTEN